MRPAAALVLFARAPRLGQVKTRLQPDLTAEQALGLHVALTRDALALVRGAARREGAIPVLAASEPLDPGGPLAADLAGIDVIVQAGADLGERLVRAFQDMLQHGARRVVVIGSDSPTLGAEVIHAAFAALADHDVALAPAEDGGYVLIGCSRLHPALFRRIPWGGPTVRRETERRLRREKIPHALLRGGRDLDTRDDLVAIYRELERLESGGAAQPAPHTLHALREILRDRPDWVWGAPLG